MSIIRADSIKNRSGLGAPDFPNGITVTGIVTATTQIVVGSAVTANSQGIDVTGVVTATTFSGSAASLTSIPAANITGTLPAIDGSNLTNVGGGLQSVQVFTTAGTATYTKPSGITKVRIYCTGGGAGGGAGTNAWNNGGGGGAGGTSIKLLDVTSISSVTVTVGAGGAGAASGNNRGAGGGTSSFGSHCTGTGGEGGGYGWNDDSIYGNGGTGTGGDININGGDGGSNGGGDIKDESASGAVGGASYWGGGGQNGSSVYLTNEANYKGKPGQAYGSGGGGSDDDSGTNYTAGDGKAGVVYVEEYA